MSETSPEAKNLDDDHPRALKSPIRRFLTVNGGFVDGFDFGIGGEFGSGIIITNVDNSWSGPCGISLVGFQIGFGIGVEKINHILLIQDDSALKLFETKRTWKIGTDFSIATGFIGADISMGVILNEGKNMKPLYSYSMAKGAYIGVTLNGSLISVNDTWNEEFYSRKMNVSDIFHNSVITPPNTEYLNLIRYLDENCLKKKISASKENKPQSTENQ